LLLIKEKLTENDCPIPRDSLCEQACPALDTTEDSNGNLKSVQIMGQECYVNKRIDGHNRKVKKKTLSSWNRARR